MSIAFKCICQKINHAFFNLKDENSFFTKKNNKVIYSKNNVCVHELFQSNLTKPFDTNKFEHKPGYLTIICLNDNIVGFTLILQWLPNAALEKNPTSINYILSQNTDENEHKAKNNTNILNFYNTKKNDKYINSNFNKTLKLKENVFNENYKNDKATDKLNTIENQKDFKCFNKRTVKQSTKKHCFVSKNIESQNLSTNFAPLITKNCYQTKNSTSLTNKTLFSVNLGEMRSIRIFFSNPECTSGQLIISSFNQQYKIFHFHYGGLDKLAQLFKQWNKIKITLFPNEICTIPNEQKLFNCYSKTDLTKLDPDEGLYSRVTFEFWESHKNKDGSIKNVLTIKKAIYFASIESALQKEIWPYLLQVIAWNSTYKEQKITKKKLFLSYQNINNMRINEMENNPNTNLFKVENIIMKDVVRTDRKNLFFAGKNNPNMKLMNSILLNYAFSYPEIFYIQGMSDFLSSILYKIRDESLTYWCFVSLMQKTLFCPMSNSEKRNSMEVNLEYLRELLKFFVPEFFSYLISLGNDASQLMFVHRWILLFFKREFSKENVFHLWEAFWCKYRTSYFYLFVCTAIVSIYGPNIVAQNLPHDEILFYFSSLAMHMDANVIFKKARGFVYSLYYLENIPSTLSQLLCKNN